MIVADRLYNGCEVGEPSAVANSERYGKWLLLWSEVVHIVEERSRDLPGRSAGSSRDPFPGPQIPAAHRSAMPQPAVPAPSRYTIDEPSEILRPPRMPSKGNNTMPRIVVEDRVGVLVVQDCCSVRKRSILGSAGRG